MQRMIVAALLAVLSVGCASGALKPPPSLSPLGQKYWYADEAVTALDTVRDVSMALNQLSKCDEQGKCQPLLAGSDTRLIVETIRTAHAMMLAVPDGWAAAMKTALEQLDAYLSDEAKERVGPYLIAARAVLSKFVKTAFVAPVSIGEWRYA